MRAVNTTPPHLYIWPELSSYIYWGIDTDDDHIILEDRLKNCQKSRTENSNFQLLSVIHSNVKSNVRSIITSALKATKLILPIFFVDFLNRLNA